MIKKKDLLGAFSDDVPMLTSILHEYLIQYNKKISEIEQALGNKDFEKIAFSAHSLKGMIGNFTTEKPYQYAYEVETKAKENDISSTKKTFSLLKEELATFDREVSAWIHELS
jgi:HPt (histidine-containing phosphotransfer) domain-containing protein